LTWFYIVQISQKKQEKIQKYFKPVEELISQAIKSFYSSIDEEEQEENKSDEEEQEENKSDEEEQEESKFDEENYQNNFDNSEMQNLIETG
jgi:uncharacterized protein (DUF1330 family)